MSLFLCDPFWINWEYEWELEEDAAQEMQLEWTAPSKLLFYVASEIL